MNKLTNGKIKFDRYPLRNNTDTALLIWCLALFYRNLMYDIIIFEKLFTFNDLIAYFKDIDYDDHEDIETVRLPLQITQEKNGDCDDKALFALTWDLVIRNKPCKTAILVYKQKKNQDDFVHINNGYLVDDEDFQNYKLLGKKEEFVPFDFTYKDKIGIFTADFVEAKLIRAKPILVNEIDRIMYNQDIRFWENESNIIAETLNFYTKIIDNNLQRYYINIDDF